MGIPVVVSVIKKNILRNNRFIDPYFQGVNDYINIQNKDLTQQMPRPQLLNSLSINQQIPLQGKPAGAGKPFINNLCFHSCMANDDFIYIFAVLTTLVL